MAACAPCSTTPTCWAISPEALRCCVATSSRRIRRRCAFVEQSARAADWSREHPDEARKVVAKILNARGENGDLAQYWGGFGLRQGARATERDLDFWIGVLERDGSLPKGKYRAADLLLPVEPASSN